MVNEVGSVVSFPVAMPRTISHGGMPPAGRGHQEVEKVGLGVQIQSGLHAQIRQAKDAIAEAAMQIRGAHAGLSAADQLLREIKTNLTHIVKQYPPYAQDNPERIAYLNSITGLRKQLEALAFPPAAERPEIPAQAARIMDWQQVMPPAAVLPRQGDLAIPELNPQTAKDAEVINALDMVNRTRENIAQMQKTMWEDVMRFVGGLDAERATFQADQIQGYVAGGSSRTIGGGAQQVLMDAG